MAKITLTDIANLQSETSVVAAVNNNNTAIETAIENTLSRDGTSPNTMGAILDMNSFRIINLPSAVGDNDPVRLGDLPLGSSTISFGAVTGKPTTLAGYGITDAAALVHTHVMANITDLPANLLAQAVSTWPTTIEKTANYTVVATDHLKTILLNGSFTLSLTAAATLTNKFFFYVVNKGSRRVTIDPNGSELIDGTSTQFIYPGQGYMIACDGTSFYTVGKPTRWKTAGATIYCSAIGSDSNDGLTSGSPMLTIQTAVNFCLYSVDSGVNTNTIVLADGTYDQRFEVVVDGVGSNQIAVTGNATTPTNCTLAPSSGGAAIVYVKDKGICTLTGVYLHSTTAAAAIAAEQLAVIDLNNIAFGTMNVGTHLRASNGYAQINVNTNCDIWGPAVSFCDAEWEGRITLNNAVFTNHGTNNFTYFFLSQWGGIIQVSSSSFVQSGGGALLITTTTNNGLAQLGGIISKGGITIPGNKTDSAVAATYGIIA